jgi:hypothetical protein
MRLLMTCASQEEADSLGASARIHASRAEYGNPHGMCWGDWSNAYLFYCTRCKPLRLRSIVQTS